MGFSLVPKISPEDWGFDVIRYNVTQAYVGFLTRVPGSAASSHRSLGKVLTSVRNDRWNLQRASRAGSWNILHTRTKWSRVFLLWLSSSYESKMLVKISVIRRLGCMVVRWNNTHSQEATVRAFSVCPCYDATGRMSGSN